jgi:hypothetical protein
MIKACQECDRPAVGRIAKAKSKTGPAPTEELLCAECMLEARKIGHAVEQLEPRDDLVERVKYSIRVGQYDEETFEGTLALDMAVGKLMARQMQRRTSPRCKWDGEPCGLRSCSSGGCFLDTRWSSLHGKKPQ